MAVTHFSPAPGRFGETYVTPCLPNIGAGTSAGVVSYLLPPVFRLAYLKRVSFVMGTIATGTGAYTAAIVKTRIGGATVVLTPEVSLFGRTVGQSFAVDLVPGVLDADATVREGESLSLRLTNTGGTIGVQALQFHVTAELAVLR
jgi:hypothetical protein